MSKHTPGPWSARRRRGQAFAAVSEWRVSQTSEGEDGLLSVARGVSNEATARLIAAAPDMLAALQQFVDAFDKELVPQRPHLSAMLLAKLNAKAVIAKATCDEDEGEA